MPETTCVSHPLRYRNTGPIAATIKPLESFEHLQRRKSISILRDRRRDTSRRRCDLRYFENFGTRRLHFRRWRFVFLRKLLFLVLQLPYERGRPGYGSDRHQENRGEQRSTFRNRSMLVRNRLRRHISTHFRNPRFVCRRRADQRSGDSSLTSEYSSEVAFDLRLSTSYIGKLSFLVCGA